MPGTVQATVLEFKSSSHPSASSLKVSMGKRHYQTRDKGDFSFPITKLGEDLVLAFVDAGGNEMARADIRLVQIIEKGCWDEVFPLDGDGHVHMRLQVILNEEDRNRIRIMRESAMKKKQETNPTNINLRLAQSASSTYNSVETCSDTEKVSDSQKKLLQTDKASPNIQAPLSQAGSSMNSATSSVDSCYTYQKEEGNIQGNAIPVKEFSVIQVKTESPRTHERIPDERIKIQSPFANVRSDIHQGAVSMQSEPAISNKNSSVPRRSQDDLSHNSQNQSPLKTTPSTVKKMISAFEKTQLQDVKSLRKSSSVPSHLNRAGKGSSREVQEPKVSIQPAVQNLRKHKDQFSNRNLHQTTSSVNREPHIVPNMTELSEAPKELESSIEPKPIIEKASHVEDSSRAVPRQTVAKESEGSPIVLLKKSTLETEKRSVDAEQFREVEANNSFADSLVREGREICVKSSHEEKIPSESEMLEKRELKQGTKYEMEKDQKTSTNPPVSGSGSSPHESSNKLVGQVIKIAVILGFGLLVLLTRQKEPRKKSREVNVDLFTVPDYTE